MVSLQISAASGLINLLSSLQSTGPQLFPLIEYVSLSASVQSGFAASTVNEAIPNMRMAAHRTAALTLDMNSKTGASGR
jgi:hypothetical protein